MRSGMNADANGIESKPPLDRVALMWACAHATRTELAWALAAFEHLPAIREIRPPESGLVMVRGRVGGEGTAFNIGEALVTRASVALGNGSVGHACLLGRASTRARMAATLDALGQDPEVRSRLQDVFVSAVIERVARDKRRRAEEVAATRVDFFTLMRGENQ